MIKKLFLFVVVCFASAQGWAQQPPGSEIYVLDLTVSKGIVSVANPQNVTNQPGYDNQPAFHPTKPLVYYASANAEGRTDLWEYNLATAKKRNLTNTTEREYSPTVTPDGKFLSCIIQRDNGAQDLGKYPIDGGQPTVLINNLIVGYHAWINEDELLLFVLGDTFTLHRYTIATKQDNIVAEQIGRSLHKIPKTNSMSFIKKNSDQPWSIMQLNKDGSINQITQALPGREDLTWTPDGKILMSDGKKLYYFDTKNPAEWKEIILPTNFPSGAITRLAVNKKGTKLAMVVSE
jgi:Tol biopolymer transport system component